MVKFDTTGRPRQKQIFKHFPDISVRVAPRISRGNTWEEFSAILNKHGIGLRTTAPYVHENAAIAERLWRTLEDMSRALLATSGLENRLWPPVFRHSMYLYNRLPHPHHNNTMSPYENVPFPMVHEANR